MFSEITSEEIHPPFHIWHGSAIDGSLDYVESSRKTMIRKVYGVAEDDTPGGTNLIQGGIRDEEKITQVRREECAIGLSASFHAQFISPV